MGGDEFERFILELLPRIDPSLGAIEPTFNMLGKTTRGKCDAHVYHPATDEYTVVLCTSQQTDCRSKILADIEKVTEAKFASKIRDVLLCVNVPFRDEVEEYRDACKSHGWKLRTFSLEQLTKEALGHGDLIRSYLGNVVPFSDSSSSQRRFDCGARLKIAREDIGLQPSQLIELMNFVSEREWSAIESSQMEAPEDALLRLSDLTGVSCDWLKHGLGSRYPVEYICDYESEKPSEISELNPLCSYMTIEPQSMQCVLIAKFSEYRWYTYAFRFDIKFWAWIDDHHHIPQIYSLLSGFNKELHPYGRMAAESDFDELLRGDIHPSGALDRFGRNSYWFEDLFDLDHLSHCAKGGYSHYGEWFVKLQAAFRGERK